MHSFKRIIIIIIIPRQKKPGASQPAELGLRYNFYFDWTGSEIWSPGDACQMMGDSVTHNPGQSGIKTSSPTPGDTLGPGTISHY